MTDRSNGSPPADGNVTPLGRRALRDAKPSAPVAFDPDATSPKRQRTASTRTWLEGSRTARKWNVELIGWAALIVGVGVIGSVLIRQYVAGTTGAVLAALALWASMAVPVAMAFRRGRPRGLLRFRAADVLYGVALGGALRLVQGWLEVAAGGSGAFPSYPLLNGSLPGAWWLLELVGPVLIAPTVEEFLFRGLLVVAVYRIARRGLDGAMLAIVASTAAFVALHAITGMSSWEEPVTLALVSLVCCALVLLTGRIWGAVLVHLVFNASAMALTLTGTVLA